MILGSIGTNFHVDLGFPCYLACLVASLWLPGGPWGDPGTSGSTKKDTLRSRLGFMLFFGDLGTPFWQLFGYIGPKKCVLQNMFIL